MDHFRPVLWPVQWPSRLVWRDQVAAAPSAKGSSPGRGSHGLGVPLPRDSAGDPHEEAPVDFGDRHLRVVLGQERHLLGLPVNAVAGLRGVLCRIPEEVMDDFANLIRIHPLGHFAN